MKRFIVTVMLAAAFSVGLAACNNASTQSTGQENVSNKSEAQKTEEENQIDDNELTITSVYENIDAYDLQDGTYNVKVDFSQMANNDGSIALNFGIYTPVHYERDDIENLKKGQSINVHWGETDDESKVVVVETVDVGDDYVTVNGGLFTENGQEFMIDDSGYYRVVLASDATYYTCYGFIDMEVPETVNFEDSFVTPDEIKNIEGSELYEYFDSLSEDDKALFTQNCTFITVKDGVITEFYRVYVP